MPHVLTLDVLPFAPIDKFDFRSNDDGARDQVIWDDLIVDGSAVETTLGLEAPTPDTQAIGILTGLLLPAVSRFDTPATEEQDSSALQFDFI